MKKICLLAIPAFLFSFDVNFNKKFSKSLIQDTLTTNLSIVVEDDSERKINSILSKFNKKIKSYDKVEKDFGRLTIRPNYRTSSNAPKIIGYRGELSYQVNTNKASFMNEFINELIKLKKQRSTNIIINNLSWTVKNSSYEVAQEELRLSAINWINKYAENLSKNLDKECQVKKITIHDNDFRPMARMAYSSNEAISSDLPVPQSNKEKVTIHPSFVMECN